MSEKLISRAWLVDTLAQLVKRRSIGVSDDNRTALASVERLKIGQEAL